MSRVTERRTLITTTRFVTDEPGSYRYLLARGSIEHRTDAAVGVQVTRTVTDDGDVGVRFAILAKAGHGFVPVSIAVLRDAPNEVHAWLEVNAPEAFLEEAAE